MERSQFLTNLLSRASSRPADQTNQMDISRLWKMVVGIGVAHRFPRSCKDAPSVVGVVATIDEKYGQWPSQRALPGGLKQMVSKFEDIIVQQLRVWRKDNA